MGGRVGEVGGQPTDKKRGGGCCGVFASAFHVTWVVGAKATTRQTHDEFSIAPNQRKHRLA